MNEEYNIVKIKNRILEISTTYLENKLEQIRCNEVFISFDKKGINVKHFNERYRSYADRKEDKYDFYELSKEYFENEIDRISRIFDATFLFGQTIERNNQIKTGYYMRLREHDVEFLHFEKGVECEVVTAQSDLNGDILLSAKTQRIFVMDDAWMYISKLDFEKIFSLMKSFIERRYAALYKYLTMN